MAGYIDDTEGFQPVDKPARTTWWKTILFCLAYMIPLFWLWTGTDFPDSLGIHITAHGRVGLLENWYYSYLLLQRHHVLDIITFIYMWSIVIGFIGWIAFKQLRKTKLPLFLGRERLGAQDVMIADRLAYRAALPSFSPSEWVLLSILSVVLLLGFGWALDFHPKRFSTIIDTSEHTVRGRCFNEKGSYPQSDANLACKQLLEDSTLAIRNQPNDADAYFDRGFAYEHAGDLNHAIADFSQVIRLTPDRSQAYFFRWAAYKDLGDKEQADADFAKLDRLDPTFAAELRNHR